METTKVNFSKHASERLLSRNITLTGEQLERLSAGVDEAKKKGIKESLVMLDDLYFIVSVTNDTVVTALDKETSDRNVFTNIDGAVLV